MTTACCAALMLGLSLLASASSAQDTTRSEYYWLIEDNAYKLNVPVEWEYFDAAGSQEDFRLVLTHLQVPNTGMLNAHGVMRQLKSGALDSAIAEVFIEHRNEDHWRMQEGSLEMLRNDILGNIEAPIIRSRSESKSGGLELLRFDMVMCSPKTGGAYALSFLFEYNARTPSEPRDRAMEVIARNVYDSFEFK